MPNVAIDTAASGDTTLVAAPTATQFIRVMSYVMTAAGSVVVKMYDGTNEYVGPATMAAASTISDHGNREPAFDCQPGQPLKINLSAPIQVSGVLRYVVKGS